MIYYCVWLDCAPLHVFYVHSFIFPFLYHYLITTTHVNFSPPSQDWQNSRIWFTTANSCILPQNAAKQCFRFRLTPERRIWLFCIAIITTVNSPWIWRCLLRLGREFSNLWLRKSNSPSNDYIYCFVVRTDRQLLPLGAHHCSIEYLCKLVPKNL